MRTRSSSATQARAAAQPGKGNRRLTELDAEDGLTIHEMPEDNSAWADLNWDNDEGATASSDLCANQYSISDMKSSSKSSFPYSAKIS